MKTTLHAVLRSRGTNLLATTMIVLAVLAGAQSSSKVGNDQQVRNVERALTRLEQDRDYSQLDVLSDDWIYMSTGGVFTKTQFEKSLKQNKNPKPYTINKQDMRVDLFGDTAVVTYVMQYDVGTKKESLIIHEHRTDVLTRTTQGWLVRFSRLCPSNALPGY